MAAACWFPSPWTVLLAAVGFGLPLGWWILDRALIPATRVLQALRDGVQGYRDHDFSLNLAADRGDELGELVELYNAVGDVLRDERSALIQREMLLETVFEATPTAIVLTDARGRILFVNRSARELFVTRGRYEGRAFADILAECPEGLREALASGRDSLFSLRPGGRGGGLPRRPPRLRAQRPAARPHPGQAADPRAAAPGGGRLEAGHPHPLATRSTTRSPPSPRSPARCA